jgi:hypothetical protein
LSPGERVRVEEVADGLELVVVGSEPTPKGAS